ncbi:hypothetical protein BP5796_02090 [Coleophoma crateriformis]|uniref:EGF-like domain-containing protein n=1 Tax=Coleophoma crateriformis TaxID=565419 RepID=A0A3D8SX84_9HELO|nr:hypothetical protein BP5796_02090 [Coleophoma crateriformis]
MLFFKSALTLSALLALASAMARERIVPAHSQMSVLIGTEVEASAVRGTQAPSDSAVHTGVSHHYTAPSFAVSKSDCEKEDEDDCKEFCGLSDQTATCAANGNKVTCFCKGGKSETNCEERCLFCMPDKSALEEASRLFKIGGPRAEEL